MTATPVTKLTAPGPARPTPRLWLAAGLEIAAAFAVAVLVTRYGHRSQIVGTRPLRNGARCTAGCCCPLVGRHDCAGVFTAGALHLVGEHPRQGRGRSGRRAAWRCWPRPLRCVSCHRPLISSRWRPSKPSWWQYPCCSSPRAATDAPTGADRGIPRVHGCGDRRGGLLLGAADRTASAGDSRPRRTTCTPPPVVGAASSPWWASLTGRRYSPLSAGSGPPFVDEHSSSARRWAQFSALPRSFDRKPHEPPQPVGHLGATRPTPGWCAHARHVCGGDAAADETACADAS